MLDDRALLAALAYVDLNPIRAGITEQLEHSNHTSVQRRIAAAEREPILLAQPLLPIAGLQVPILALTTADYLQLVDWTGRQLRPGNRGAIPAHAPAILQRFGIEKTGWSREVRGVGSDWYRAIGGACDLLQLAQSLGQSWLRGIGFARGLGLR